MLSSVRQALGLLAVSGVLFFSALGGAALWDEDEPIFAGAAREMMARHEWVVPYFNGAMLPDKPVLTYWVMIAGYKLFGPTEFAARAGSAVFSMGTVLLTWALGRRLFSAQVGVWAGVVLASSLSFDVVSRAATPDAVLTFFCTLAVLCYIRWLGQSWPHSFIHNSSTPSASDAPVATQPGHGRDNVLSANSACSAALPQPPSCGCPTVGNWLALAGCYASIGMAVLAKGPIGLILPVTTIGLYRLFALPLTDIDSTTAANAGWLSAVKRTLRDLARRFHPRRALQAVHDMHLLPGLVIALAIAGPWYVAVGLRTDGAWLAGFLGKHNLERFLHPLEHHRGPLFYYLIAIIIGFFPWSLFFGPLASFIRPQLNRLQDSQPYRLLLCWVVAYLGFFSMAATKLPNYIVPLYPALALLTGAWIDAWLSGKCSIPARKLRGVWMTLIVVGIALVSALPIVAQKLLGYEPLLALVGLPLIVGGALCWWWHARGQASRVAVAFGATAVTFSLMLFGFGAVEIGRYQTSRPFAEAIQRQTANGPAILWTFGYWRPSLTYYLGYPVQQVFDDDDVRAFCDAWPYHGFLLVTGDRFAKVAEWLPGDVHVLKREKWFLRRDELLLLGRDETTDTRVGTLPWQKSSNQ